MSKIVQAVNAMISHPEKITNVIRGRREIFFLYKDKYKWSIMQDDGGDVRLWYYPGADSLQSLASYEDTDWEGTPMVSYRSGDIGTREAQASFSDLYSLLKERVHGINEVLDDIISDNDEF